ncbi:bacterioferritin comigratory protein [Rhodopirellula sallentina SM41]|uniref:thioredoxin-dependent peroxiredoxin n=2 Tax=Rhodopirellula TaxID=265488 RepID=M5UHU5_9BACT|nr:bacterioferritin comigratory protein [Rhodopirellula sallentina SM41]
MWSRNREGNRPIDLTTWHTITLAIHFTPDTPTMADYLEPGKKAPAFTLKDQDGNTVRLKDLAGNPVVLYFYPRDNTPGCTKEACAFRDRYDEMKSLGAQLFGISTDSAESHVKFRDEYELPFPLLVDANHAMSEKYGAWREKNMYGKKSMGMQRCTYVLDDAGKVVKVWKRVRVDGHDQQVIDVLTELGSDS